MKREVLGKVNAKFNAVKATALCALSVVALAATPAQAKTDVALDACIQEFMATHLAGYGGKVTVRKETAEVPTTLPLVAATHRIVSVDAVHRRSGERLASVTCHVDSEGQVTAMKTAHRSAKLAALKGDAVAKNEVK